MRLSHSQINSYLDCPEKHNLHYNHKLRSKYQSAALCFGTALDQSVPALIKGEDYLSVFFKIFSFQTINGKETHLPRSVDIVYSSSDLDADLLVEDDFKKISLEANKENYGQKEIDKLLQDKEEMGGFENLPRDLQVLHNYIHWLCLYRKGIIMLESFKKYVMPNIEVISFQEQVNLSNGEDSVIGYIDMVARYKGYSKPIIFDLKTSSRNYDKNAVLSSSQLGLYVHAVSDKYENTKLAGYLVINKHINKNKVKICSVCKHDGTGSRAKKCDNEIPDPKTILSEVKNIRCNGEWIETIKPSAFIQVLINEIPERFENLLLDNIDDVNKAIKSGNVYKNLNSCIKPYGKCAYYNKCHYGNEDDLVKV